MPDDQANPILPTEGGTDSPTTTTTTDTPAPAGLTVDGVTYTSDQVKALLKDSTDYKSLTPEYTKQQQLLKDPAKLREYIAATYPDLIPKAPAGEPSELDQAFKVLKEQGNFLTREEAQQQAQKLVQDILDQREANHFNKKEIADLTKEYDGQSGKPKFDFEAARQHALEKGFPSLTSAFEDLNKNAIREWYAANKIRPKAPTVARPGATGVPVSKEKGPNLNDMGAVKKDALEFFGGE